MANSIPAIPDPGNDVASIKSAVLALKQAVEVFAGVRGNKSVSAAATQSDIASINSKIDNILQRLAAHGI